MNAPRSLRALLATAALALGVAAALWQWRSTRAAHVRLRLPLHEVEVRVEEGGHPRRLTREALRSVHVVLRDGRGHKVVDWERRFQPGHAPAVVDSTPVALPKGRYTCATTLAFTLGAGHPLVRAMRAGAFVVDGDGPHEVPLQERAQQHARSP